MNLLWLVPGVVGGSEEYTTRLLPALADLAPADLDFTLFVNGRFDDAYPDSPRFRTVVAPGRPEPKARGWPPRPPGSPSTRRRPRRADAPPRWHVPRWRPGAGVLTIHDLQPLAKPERFGGQARLHRLVCPGRCGRRPRS